MTKTTSEIQSLGQVLESSTWLNLILAIQLVVGITYVYVTGDTVGRWTHFVIPFIWFTASGWVLWHTRPPTTSWIYRVGAGLFVAIYFLIMLYFSGLVGPSTSHLGQLTGATDYGLTWGRSLGWSPVLLYTGNIITATIIPYQAVGLFAMAYLVYDAVLSFSQSAVGGVIGIVACPACVSPIVLALVGGVGGTTTTILFGTYGYEFATVLFLLGLAILYHRNRLAIVVSQLQGS